MKLASVEIFYIMAIYFNRTTVYIIEAHEQLNHGGFSCTGRTYNCNFLTVSDLCRKIVDNDLFRIITEAYMIKFYISAEPVNRNAFALVVSSSSSSRNSNTRSEAAAED